MKNGWVGRESTRRGLEPRTAPPQRTPTSRPGLLFSARLVFSLTSDGVLTDLSKTHSFFFSLLAGRPPDLIMARREAARVAKLYLHVPRFDTKIYNNQIDEIPNYEERTARVIDLENCL